MPQIYQFDSVNVWTGEVREITDMEGAPINWTFSDPPVVPAGKFALFCGPEWIIIDKYPPVHSASVLGQQTAQSDQPMLTQPTVF